MGVLLMLMTVGGLLVAGAVLIGAVVTRKTWLARFTAVAVTVWFVFYGVMLLGFSVTSPEVNLAVNEPKAFCGFYLDCHLHAQVTGVRTASRLGDKSANGVFYIIGIRVFSDARNPSITFRLLQPKATVVDPSGRSYERDQAAEKLLPSGGIDLAGDIRGKQTIEKEMVFDLPKGVVSPRLDMSEGYGVDRVIEAVLVGDEDSLLHKRTYFQLPEQNIAQGVK